MVRKCQAAPIIPVTVGGTVVREYEDGSGCEAQVDSAALHPVAGVGAKGDFGQIRLDLLDGGVQGV